MNLSSTYSYLIKKLFRIALRCRGMLPKGPCFAFDGSGSREGRAIERIHVINLHRQKFRWFEMERELRRVLDKHGNSIWNLTERFDAIDALDFLQDPLKDKEVDPIYYLKDQLFVEPQPNILPGEFKLDAEIRMSRAEIAVAKSHIALWRKIATQDYKYVLILEDDIWLRPGFAKKIERAWRELSLQKVTPNKFDIFYVSFQEVKNGAPKTVLSKNMFRPQRGLWHLSGYVLSQTGARKLLEFLPSKGPIDLWINYCFNSLEVVAISRPIIIQRRDLISTNSYSILPALTKVGALTSEKASLFQVRPKESPVFVFGSEDSGLSSISMALLMLGYTCCSDLDEIPSTELEALLIGDPHRSYNAYSNIVVLENKIEMLKKLYAKAKFIIVINNEKSIDRKCSKLIELCNGADVLILFSETVNKWKIICEFLRCAPPSSTFPKTAEKGIRKFATLIQKSDVISSNGKHDKSPWIINQRLNSLRIVSFDKQSEICKENLRVNYDENFQTIDETKWLVRDDTFTDNLALFRTSNIICCPNTGAEFKVKKESLGVRKYSAAAVTSREEYLYGRFEATIKAAPKNGIVTGFFLHRDSPRQEIDIEITGNKRNQLLINVFYNPGDVGAKYDYGYRGSPVYIDLGFDASESYHKFSIEWQPNEIKWFVDDTLVHHRFEWDPTPIPHLPMAIHFNSWPTRSKELAGALADRSLPSSSFIKSLKVDATKSQTIIS